MSFTVQVKSFNVLLLKRMRGKFVEKKEEKIMEGKDVRNFLRTLGSLMEAYNQIELALNQQPEIEGCEIQIQAMNQAQYWISQACNNWLLIGKNIVDYNKNEWVGAFLAEGALSNE